jgi:hypothetical protein
MSREDGGIFARDLQQEDEQDDETDEIRGFECIGTNQEVVEKKSHATA